MSALTMYLEHRAATVTEKRRKKLVFRPQGDPVVMGSDPVCYRRFLYGILHTVLVVSLTSIIENVLPKKKGTVNLTVRVCIK